jgi:hypothetical protein
MECCDPMQGSIYWWEENGSYRIAFTSVRLPRASRSTRVSAGAGELFSGEARLDVPERCAGTTSFVF